MAPSSTKSISAVIIPAEQLANQIKETLKQSPPAIPSDLDKKARPIQCTVRNATQFNITLQGSYFDSGRYWTAPGSVAPFGTMTFSGCNGDNSILTGVSGGNNFELFLDGTTSFRFSLGWTNPWSGAYKAGVTESSSAEDGYKAVNGAGNTIESSSAYEGKNKDGNGTSKCYFHISAAPGKQATYDITQILM